MLSNKTVNTLAQSLAAEVVGDLYASDAFIEFLHEAIPDLIKTRLGDVNEDLLFELSLATMDRVRLTTYD